MATGLVIGLSLIDFSILILILSVQDLKGLIAPKKYMTLEKKRTF